MLSLIQIIVILFVVFALSRAFLRFKDKKISNMEFVFWVIVWLAVLTVVFRPEITNVFANYLGIERGIDVVIYLGILLLFYLMFRLYVKIDVLEKNITKVVRKEAIEKAKRGK